ncbi:MAG: hypothetical protein KJ620_01615 [Candidatus Edwardsbacteria bacterium]|nr:hypothetical protein [Candidatus Edwardsbacteria bacterium]MBU1577245.1 hypothetical protein [Candidatus Edwardsbacteria bacterium]MBU2463173.1 hypothetical protein [Candidatus Edwardsbacteria bacterium]MBU2592916.1 hypothetical protein [Candidatus Edwardsbacteria bacterium]
MVPPEDNQKDAGQFNAWLTNLAPKPPPRPAVPGQAPAAPRAPIGKPAGMPSPDGLLGAGLDDELDDIFGKIVTADAPAAAAPPAMPKPVPPPPPQQMAPRPPAPPAANIPQPPPRMPIQEAPAPPPQQTVPRPAAPPAFNIPQPPPVQPAVPTAPAQAASQSTYKQIEAAVNEVRQEMQDKIDQLELKHHSEIQGAVSRAQSEMQAQRQNDVQNATAQGRVEVQAKIQEIQLKYQEQRQKWEKVLKDLRDRNEELTARNHELEEQLSQLRERQRTLIQEYAGISAPQAAPVSPIQIDEPGGPEIVFPGEEPQSAIPEISIEMPEAIAGEQESAEADQAIRARNENTLSEADDLLAELDALENDMKNLGEDN